MNRRPNFSGGFLCQICFAVRLPAGFGLPDTVRNFGIAEFVCNGRCGLGGVFTRLLCYFPL
ncbi:hypothetical protein NEICINOT_03165 [Neisseria cinerea ATCC 14685]|uniref:Uncharacterized protein n=1 Tax=Neisseria cinerea ATCC 14685 TaxID=546262 RepID=D0W0J9_NEICI|nr:hypothetical protein NEICINOT_03165 [Neisseria cinerea ATCC 14685]